MAYGIKYRFRFWSEHGVLHTVNLLQDGYSGTVTERPLGKAPVIRMQENGAFRSTSCNLTLECQSDGEFADLYTSDPKEFRIDVFRGGTLSAGGTLVWQGFVATEIYAEPDIAPPYDVDITSRRSATCSSISWTRPAYPCPSTAPSRQARLLGHRPRCSTR